MSRNRQRTKDPRGGYRVGKSAKKDTARAIRHQHIPEPEALPRVKRKLAKNKKRWCKGKVGREHVLVVRTDRKWYNIRWVRVCIVCTKELDYWYDTAYYRTNKPQWVSDDEERRREQQQQPRN